MSRKAAFVSVALASAVAFLLGLAMTGAIGPSTPTPPGASGAAASRTSPAGLIPASLVDFAEVAARVNPAVVNVDASVPGRGSGRRPAAPGDPFHDHGHAPVEPGDPQGEDPDAPQEGSGSGFIIDRDGHILTNHHVIDGAARIVITLSDGRAVRARVVGSDQPTDVALLKVDGLADLPVAPLGDSSTLRVGEWVCAIGNPLGYEHTVTVGVVSYLGRKLWDPSLDDYIQTDAAITFGNSGGPLINIRGEVVGISAAMSGDANSIGFAVPINQATGILAQLKASGRVSRGYIGATLRDVDADLAQALSLPAARGALVQDLAPGSPGERAGLRPYDQILSVDGADVSDDVALIRDVSARAPGSVVRLRVWRDGREEALEVELSDRPSDAAGPDDAPVGRLGAVAPPAATSPVGLTVREIDRAAIRRLQLPDGLQGVIVTAVEPMGPAEAADILKDDVVIEINRQPVRNMAAYTRLVAALRPGDAAVFYCYEPAERGRALRVVHVEPTQR